MNESSTVLGIDIGGSGIKAAPVDIVSGELTAPRIRIETPEPPEPAAMIGVIKSLIDEFKWQGDIGCGFPGVVKGGEVLSAANLAPSWIGINIEGVLNRMTGGTVAVMNDADAACIAEMEFGCGVNRNRPDGGVVLMLTFGTGIGTAMFVNGTLVPNLELGHIEMKGKIAELRASAKVRKAQGLSWKKWSKRVNAYLALVERLCNPDLIIIGGGVSNRSGEFLSYLGTRAELAPAKMFNEAGIIGAALTVAYKRKQQLF